MAWTEAVAIIDSLQAPGGAETVVIDITTMPRSSFFPLIKAALQSSRFHTVMAVYSEPQKYHDRELASEPTNVSILAGFDQLPPVSSGTRQEAAWIPILGFGPLFLTAVQEALVDTYELGPRVYPVIGFPGYEPRFFERSLSDSGQTILNALRRGGIYGGDQFIYAAATDPFDTATALTRVVAASAKNLAWLGTPTGPKPMALGMLLAALRAPITVLVAPPRSYHPHYSTGFRRTHAYLLRLNGAPCY